MAKIKFGDVINKIRDTIDKDNCELKYYVAGEHFDSGEVQITKYGLLDKSTIGPSFQMHFYPGDVLLMSRRPNLKKAGIVDFEGVSSEVSYVCRTKDENILLQRYLPFILQTDSFWDYAWENKKGSTNYFLNWKDFANYEFDLPSIEEQKKLAKILWAAEDLKKKYRRLELIKDSLISQIIKDSLNHNNIKSLGDLIDLKYGKSQKNLPLGGGCPIMGTSGILGYTNKFLYEGESILIGRKGTIDKPIYIKKPFWAVDTAFYTVNKININTKWLFYFLYYLVDFLSLNEATGVPSLNSTVVKKIKIPLPNVQKQNDAVKLCVSVQNISDITTENNDILRKISGLIGDQ